MSDRLLRHKESGILYIYQDIFATRDDFEEVTPVGFVTTEALDDAPVTPRNRKARTTPGLRAATPALGSAELSPQDAIEADASRGTR